MFTAPVVLAVAGSMVHFGYFLVLMTACNLFGSALACWSPVSLIQ
jgi:hypothetical protein